jgi:hypothetical protein
MTVSRIPNGPGGRKGRGMKRLVFLIVFTLFATASGIAQFAPLTTTTPTVASFTGTYSWQAANLKDYSVAYNMQGQQVGFCNGAVVGYGCWDAQTFNLLAGTIVANGAGRLTGTATETRDPNSYKCNPKENPTSPCPVMVPSGHVFSMTTAYKTGYTVDYTVGSATRTFQAVRASTGKAPNWATSGGNICNNGNLSTCSWTQIPQSLTNNSSNASVMNFSGTYTVNSSGTGVMTFTVTGCSNCGTVQLQFTVPPVSALGQTIPINGLSALGNSNPMVGTAVRIK